MALNAACVRLQQLFGERFAEEGVDCVVGRAGERIEAEIYWGGALGFGKGVILCAPEANSPSDSSQDVADVEGDMHRQLESLLARRPWR